MNREDSGDMEIALRRTVSEAVASARVTDIHTHVFPPSFGPLLLWGIDELLTYHYLVAETLRWTDMPYQQFWQMHRTDQADLVWQKLFIENSPISEACRGVLTVLKTLGMDVGERDLRNLRDSFKSLSVDEYIDRVFNLAGLDSVVMTNDPFDAVERAIWEASPDIDCRFKAALRLDGLLVNWLSGCRRLKEWGYSVSETLDAQTLGEVRRFLTEWANRMSALYMAVSLPDSFVYPDDSHMTDLIDECILPVARELNLPFALMIGVRRQVNPQLRLAGDAVGKADVGAVEALCAKYPDNKFLVTMLARENQHQLAVTARKFRNLMIFGCWWFLNNPSLIDEITRMRVELLGLSVIPQHSDARVFDQVLYKWSHSKELISSVLSDKYVESMRAGWTATSAEIERDVAKLLGGNFWTFIDR